MKKVVFAVLALWLIFISITGAQSDGRVIIFPKGKWNVADPETLNMNCALLDQIAIELGGRGCIIKNGFIVKTWGDQAEISDWFSSAKPVLSTMLFFAIQEGLVTGTDQKISDFGWELKEKDRTMTFRHLADMTSGYARPEAPGEAWAYNDFAIQLYQKTLFEKVFRTHGDEAAAAAHRLGALGFQDGLKFNHKNRIKASVRDWARIVWFWMNRGRWAEKQVLNRRFFDEYMKPDVPKDLPRTRKADEDDYLQIGSYGGGSDQTDYGPGLYGFNWWFNETGRSNPKNPMWPDAPPDTVMSLGARGNCSAMFPSLGLAVICADGDWGQEKPGNPEAHQNQVLKLAAAACGYKLKVKADKAGKESKNGTRDFDQEKDLISLHYDHAPDRDDGQSAAADRTVLQSLFGKNWIEDHVVAVSGAYGKNSSSFRPESDTVMDIAFNDCGGWLSAHTDREDTIAKLSIRWNCVLTNGGDIWVKEGGQSDITAEVVKRIRIAQPDVKTTKRIHVIQHGRWNEEQTSDEDLAYTRHYTDYVRIKDANAYLNIKGGDASFVKAALENPTFGTIWKVAFDYYNPEKRLDFSDTGELFHILGLGEIGIKEFQNRFLLP